MSLGTVLRILAAFVVSGILAFILTPLAKRIAYKIGAIDVPKDDRRMHKKPIPRLGGLAVFFAFLVSVVLLVPMEKELQGILLGSVIIVILGVIDDSISLPAMVKFLVQIVAALVVVLHGTEIDVLSNVNVFSEQAYLSLGGWGIPVTVVWIVAITNAVNLIDGLDGLSVGVCTIASVSLLLIAAIVSEFNVAVIMAALAGACIGFLPYNMNPAKMFVGDTGATFLGFILATMSIQGMFKTYAILSFAVPFLILGLPIFDTAFAICRRLLNGQSPMHADRGHVHHRLIDMGFSQKQTVLILYLVSGIFGVAAVLLTSSGAVRALLFVVAVILAAIIALRIYLSISKHENEKKDNDEKS
ncbi:MAG: undecaprenyl/decaprenyl-phosphate alpha-N-acetylglucosaminyl 1-phosphate transferase [Oscillospiraceae bacterium]|nr:undecaprenyl/decaprenyl-phosphate alpha-N-acetylglucosaminyl 1-phosphate transferase [Oscillospiraceae bacterium]